MKTGWLLLLLAAFWVSKVQTVSLEGNFTADTETSSVEKLFEESIDNTAATKTPSAAEIFRKLVNGLDLEIQTLDHVMQKHGISATENESSMEKMTIATDLEIHTLNHVMQEHGISATENKSSMEKMITATTALSTDKAKKVTEDSIRLGFAKKYEGLEDLKKARASDQNEVPIWLIIFVIIFIVAIFLGIMHRYTSKRAKKKQDLDRGDKIEKQESQLQKGDAVLNDTEKNSTNFPPSAISP